MSKVRRYEEEANKLAAAIDIAIEAIEKYCPIYFSPATQKQFIDSYRGWKLNCLHPEPQYRNLASLKYLINDVFTYFQESSGPTVEYFWKRLNEEGLEYKRVDKLRKVLDRGRIRGRIEYEFVTDILSVALQTEMITGEEAKLLNDMIGKFEQGRK